jgi:Gpi18-like mannosyltransferase
MSKKNLLYIFLSALLLRLILSPLTWHGDLNNHMDWGIRFWQYGTKGFYGSNVWDSTWPNQPPGTMYIFGGVRKLYESAFGLFSYFHFQLHIFPGSILLYFEKNLYPALLKLPSILSDLGIGYVIYLILRSAKKPAILGAAIWLFNPVIWYNSSVWGQTDAVINFFALLAFYLLIKKQLLPAVLFFAISIYIKASLLIFAPIFLFFMILQKYTFKKVLYSFLFTFVAIILITLPFSHGNPVSWLIDIYQNRVFAEQLHAITANAFNLWAGIAGISMKPQSYMLGPLSYQIWGIILFVVFNIPIFYVAYKNRTTEALVWCASITAISSFMLLTNMHERYLYPFFPMFTLVVMYNKKLLPLYWIISGISLLNLYNFWWVPNINLLVNFLSFDDRLVPRILGFVSFGLLIYLYLKFLRQFALSKL